MNRLAVIEPSTSIQRSSPSGLIAETRLIFIRWPVAPTTGVCPLGAQVVPEW